MEFKFSNDQKIKINNSAEKKWSDYKAKNHKCYKKDCESIAIGSHAISESISLSQISVNGNMKYFESKRNGLESKSLFLKHIGKGEASKFQGFCKEHDPVIFMDIDNNKDKYYARQILLQLYRSVCYAMYNYGYYANLFNDSDFNELREYVYSSLGLDFITEDIKKINENILEDEGFIVQLKDLLETEIKKNINSFSDEYVMFHDLKIKIENLLEQTKTEEDSNQIIQNKEQRYSSSGFSFFYKKINMKIPVAILNHHFFNIKGSRTYLLFTVIPYENSTEIYWMFDEEYYEFFLEKWNEMNSIEINVLNRIESSMIQLEYWFIDPRIIDSIPTERINLIQEDIIYNHDRDIFKDYDLSIFDELRIELIKNINESVKFIEQKKINGNVQRKPKSEREELYKKYICDQIFTASK